MKWIVMFCFKVELDILSLWIHTYVYWKGELIEANGTPKGCSIVCILLQSYLKQMCVHFSVWNTGMNKFQSSVSLECFPWHSSGRPLSIWTQTSMSVLDYYCSRLIDYFHSTPSVFSPLDFFSSPLLLDKVLITLSWPSCAQPSLDKKCPTDTLGKRPDSSFCGTSCLRATE